MQEIRKIAVSEIEPDPQQPRKRFDDAETRALGQNMLAIGQQLPVIVYPNGSRFMLADGERRWRAAREAGIAELLAIVLAHRPKAAQLHVVQLSLEVHKVGTSAWERSCQLQQIREETFWSVSELAEQVHLKQSTVSKLLACQRLDTPIRELLHAGKLDLEKAVIVSQEPSHDRQREMVKLYAHLPREQFRQKAKPAAPSEQVSVKRARFYLPGGESVIVHAPELTLADAIACLLETVRQLKRAQSKNQDIAAAQTFLRTKARTSHVVVE